MAHADSQNPELLRHYEGLVYRTAQMIDRFVEDDFDDIVQELRIKVWKALEKWDPARAPKLVAKYGEDVARDRSVFAWVKNKQIDIVKKKRRGDVSLDSLGIRDTVSEFGVDGQLVGLHAAVGAEDEGFARAEAGLPLIPSTLGDMELRVMCLLYADYWQSEIAATLGIEKRDVERILRSVRRKMADWKPAPRPQLTLAEDLEVSSPAIAPDEDYPETRIAA